MTSMAVGFYPFWFWNDRLSEVEIRRQIREMAEQGVRGFFIHSRQGLAQPYLSEAFFEMVDAAVEAAQAEGLSVHLYDEYPYPSGVAGGEVIAGAPEYQATQLVQRTYDLAPGSMKLTLPPGQVLACVAYPIADDQVDWDNELDLSQHVGFVLAHESYNEMGLTQYNRKRYFASAPTPVLETVLPGASGYRLCVTVQAQVTHHKYWGGYVDALNPEAIARFIELTHERYYRRYGDAFGATILSIFADETAPGWSSALPEAFDRAYGYDLIGSLPALQCLDHPDHKRVAYDLGKLRYDLFCEAFEAQLADWCHNHSIAYAGEKPSVRMAQLRYMDIPGCEPGHTKVGARPDWLQARLRSNAKATAAAAYFYGKLGALCECYHSTGWSATLQDAKAIADGLLLAGIQYLVPHGFFYSTHALKKHDAPPTFFFQMPFWPFFGQLSEHVARVAQAFDGTHIAAEILMVDPGSGVPLHEDRAAYPYLQAYEDLLWALMRHHLDFQIVDTDILEAGTVVDGSVTVADVVARVVVVPAMPVVEPPLQAWLERFASLGGIVLRSELSTGPDAVLEALRAHVAPSLRATVDGKEAEDLLLVKREGSERTLWFGLNIGDKTLEMTFESAERLRERPLNPALPAQLRQADGRYHRRVAPFESLLLEAVSREAPAPSRHRLPRLDVKVDGPALLRPLSANLLRLDDWQMALRQPDGGYGPAASVSGMPLANQLSESALPFAPAFQHYFGHVPDMALPEVAVRYRAKLHNTYTGPVALLMEPGTLAGAWRISMNGSAWLKEDDFAPTTAHVRGSLSVDVTELLEPGDNTIRVEVTTDRLDGGLRAPLYLSGGFGVSLTPLGLVAPIREGRFEDYVGNRLPFYAGCVEYTTTFPLTAVPEAAEVLVAFDYGHAGGAGAFHEATEVAINDGAYQPVLWTPRCVVAATDGLRVGTNRLRTRVYTTLIRSFEGQWFDYAAHRYRDVTA